MPLFGKQDKSHGQQQQEVMDEKKMEENLLSEARKALGIDAKEKYNIAFTGLSGVGKSSLINALRQVDDSDASAADVDIVECTEETKDFQHPTLPRLVLWDMPGAGTINNPAQTYFLDKRLYVFDCLIIVTGARVLQVDVEVAKQAQKFNLPVIFVRNKAREALDTIQSKHPKQSLEDSVKETKSKIIKSIQDQLSIYGVTAPTNIFVIEAHDYRQMITHPENLIFDEMSLLQHVAEVVKKNRHAVK
jgi:predicted GTPase